MLRDIYYVCRSAWIAGQLVPAARRGRLARTLERLGPSFIKLGQTLSTRPDLIGPEMAADLASLRDHLPPFPTDTARRIIEQELLAPIDTLFSHFEDIPIAAASVAQVHRAALPNGKTVAVKIIRPGVTSAFRRDLKFFYWCALRLTRWVPSLRRLKPVEVVRALEETIAFELDLRYEAAAMTEMQRNTAQDNGFRIPQVEWHRTSEKVMVAEWIDGVPIHEVEQLRAAGHDPNAVLAQLSRHFFLHVFRDGFFHADMHPGNLFIDAAGNLVAVDFGIMGRLDRHERLYIAEIFRGFLKEDYEAVAEAHFRAGYVPAEHSRARFAQAAMAIAKPILDRPAHEISLASLLGQLFRVTETFQMETQPQLLLLQKTLVVVEGVGRMLNPHVNMWEMARQPIEEWAQAHFGLAGQTRYAAQEIRELMHRWALLLKKLENMLIVN